MSESEVLVMFFKGNGEYPARKKKKKKFKKKPCKEVFNITNLYKA